MDGWEETDLEEGKVSKHPFPRDLGPASSPEGRGREVVEVCAGEPEICEVLLIERARAVDGCPGDFIEESCMEEVGGWVGG